MENQPCRVTPRSMGIGHLTLKYLLATFGPRNDPECPPPRTNTRHPLSVAASARRTTKANPGSSPLRVRPFSSNNGRGPQTVLDLLRTAKKRYSHLPVRNREDLTSNAECLRRIHTSGGSPREEPRPANFASGNSRCAPTTAFAPAVIARTVSADLGLLTRRIIWDPRTRSELCRSSNSNPINSARSRP